MASHGNLNDSSALPTTAGSPRCSRCGGLLVTEYYMDLQDDTGQIDFTALRCAMCGNVTDAVILKNRNSPPPNLLYGTKARKFSQQVKRLSGNHDTDGAGGNGTD
ncbi:MAG: hypothetical protein KF814_15975 [Nitrospiraceae bacterium]|nr:hypothetical protein [Nitrospiraceae bacterium]